MKPKKINHRQGRLFETRLSDQLNPKHSLLQLSEKINWSYFEEDFSCAFSSGEKGGQPPKPVRLMVGLLMLQHMNNYSDEAVVEKWVENPYWQSFCGYDFLQWEAPIDPTSLIHWRQRLGTDRLEKILQETIRVALQTKTVKKASFKKVISDTTVMEKNITFPTDAKLYDTARKHLVKLAKLWGIKLRQNYNFVSKRHLRKVGQYGHARQYKRMKKEVKKLKTFLERIVKDIQRKWKGKEDKFAKIMPLAQRLLKQDKKSKQKLYSLCHPEVECISKGKAHKKYEFGCKVAIVTTHKEGLCMSIEAMHKNPYDGHTLETVVNKAEINTKTEIEELFLDKGYKGSKIEGKSIYLSGQRKGMTKRLKKALKRRQAIEPQIGHMKSDGKLGKNFLKGREGDKTNAILVGMGHNLRMILRKLRIFLFKIFFQWRSRQIDVKILFC